MYGISEMKGSNSFPIFHIQLLFIGFCLFVARCYSLKLGETCMPGSACDHGLRCETCPANGNTRPRCIRIQPLNPISKVKGLAFNKYSWLTTHNSYARTDAKSPAGTAIISPKNQEDTVTSQLDNGVRGLMLDLYDFQNDIWLCHSFGGQCYDYTAFQPAINVLKEVEAFLAANPSEIVTIFIEDYVASPLGLTKVFNASGLSKYFFPASKMPKGGEDWPTVDAMVQKNERLVVFTSKAAKEASEGFAFLWKYAIENKYGDPGLKARSCTNRAESPPLNTPTVSLFVLNYFPTSPNISEACSANSSPLSAMAINCYEAAGKRWPNFIAVDFYQKNDGGGAPEVVDEMNGHLTCGCGNIAYCRANAPSGTCDVPPISPPPPASSEIFSPPPLSLDINYSNTRKVQLRWLLGTILTVLLILRL
ncbi:PI-PLC X domain-containing protein At5g67130 [Manihot esculenta]|uniref:Uncharacterized protein n=1 Tax=Manihot esculenta TaxID=3983 RepID=A0ACB7GQI3_MANES|nr:PI-PLC X domain-containing protein At5g67130 [Manihot esculenta]KAG8642628.1 hypothetical protein MANES_12G103800v8 [Manihot esculenta]